MSQKIKKNQSHHLRADIFLRALAILSVLGIHILSSFKKSPYLATSDHQVLAITLDQLFRFGVPLFVALSGYGLSQKFAKTEINLKHFWRSRLKKLLPAYLFWSLIFILIFVLVPWWSSSYSETNIIWQLMFGKADYHLYFVPMILQLYLLFPLIFWFYRKKPSLVFAGALLLQLFWYWRFGYHENTPVDLSFFAGDREQYVWATNWVFYFVLGMHLPKIHQILAKNRALLVGLVISALGILAFQVNTAIFAINVEKLDPLIALRFTRYPVVLFASLAIIIMTWWAKKVRYVPLPLWWVGTKSYHIYLVHTLLLRLIF